MLIDLWKRYGTKCTIIRWIEQNQTAFAFEEQTHSTRLCSYRLLVSCLLKNVMFAQLLSFANKLLFLTSKNARTHTKCGKTNQFFWEQNRKSKILLPRLEIIINIIQENSKEHTKKFQDFFFAQVSFQFSHCTKPLFSKRRKSWKINYFCKIYFFQFRPSMKRE
jgi:hypothetical protein